MALNPAALNCSVCENTCAGEERGSEKKEKSESKLSPAWPRLESEGIHAAH